MSNDMFEGCHSNVLYTYPDSHRAYKGIIAAKYSGAGLELAPGFKLGTTNTTEEFLAKFPLGKVPALVTNSGDGIFESNAIAYYLANQQLRGADELSQALVQQWISFSDNELQPSVVTWVFPTLGLMPNNKAEIEQAKEKLKKSLAVLNDHLSTRTYLVGERLTLADISAGCTLLLAYKQVLDPTLSQPYENVNRWFSTFVNQPQVKEVVGNFVFCTKSAQFDAKKYAELHPKAAKPEKKSEPKKETPKKEVKKETAGSDEDVPPPKPKKPDAFGDFQSEFDLDAFKRCYSNEDIQTIAIPHFWENFNKEKNNFSIWYCEYSFPEDLKENMVFMTSNLIGGMFQRIEKMVKHGFGTMCVFGEDLDNTIKGVWFWKGQDLIFEKDDNWQTDFSSYKWTKLEPEAESTKQLVDSYFRFEFPESERYNVGRVFK